MRIYLPQDLSLRKALILDREHKKRLVRVMRLREGDSLEVFTPGKHWICRISRVLQDGIELEPVQLLPTPPAPKLRICLAQALIKGEKFDWLIQKATEVGVTEIIPLITQRTIVKLTRTDNRVQRWNEIAQQAAGQCENAFPATVHFPETLSVFLQRKSAGPRLLLQERSTTQLLKEFLRGVNENSITIIVGPEGGWAKEEISQMLNAGFQTVTLGSRILRAETAGLAMLTIIQYELGDLG
jgi:16S rRNA (uracil1498-N3)-methyltransferase